MKAAREQTLRALGAFFILGWRRAVASRTTTFGIALLYALILLVFWGLWQATPTGELAKANVSANQLCWYLIITECVLCAAGFPYRSIEADIQSGDIASGLLRPVSYSLAVIADALGQACFRMAILAVVGFVFGIWLTGAWPLSFTAVPLLVWSMAVGCVLLVLCQVCIGYAAAWLGTAAPIFWVWQKVLFVLGGLMIPLQLYPPMLRDAADLLPFASMLNVPASLVFEQSVHSTSLKLAMQCVWLPIVATTTWAVVRAATSRFAVRGI